MDIFFACFNHARRSEKFEQLLIIASQAANDGWPDIGVDTDKPSSLLTIGESQVSRGCRLYRQRVGPEGKRANVVRKARLQIRKGHKAVGGALAMKRIICLTSLIGGHHADGGQSRGAKGEFQVYTFLGKIGCQESPKAVGRETAAKGRGAAKPAQPYGDIEWRPAGHRFRGDAGPLTAV